jgi:hypothetical protein
MKILYICTSLDSYLKEQINALQEAKHHVDILDILEYKLMLDNGKSIFVRPKTKFKILEHFFVLDEVNEHIRRREIFDYLDRYDIVHLYKCSLYAVDLKDKIEKISLKYTITPNYPLPKKNSKVDELYKNSKLFITQDSKHTDAFIQTYGYKNKVITLYKPVNLLKVFDSINKEVYQKFLDYLHISEKKTNIFCHFKGSIHKQKELIVSLANLPLQIKNKTTFFLYMDNKDKNLNKNLLLFLKDIKLDYVIVNKDSSDEQIAMLLKASNASVFIDHSPFNHILITSIYAKTHPFVFTAKEIEQFYKRNKIYIDDFSEFTYMFDKDEINDSLLSEVLNQSKQRVYSLFSYEGFEESYIKETLR